MNRFKFLDFWFSALRSAEGVDGGSTGDGGTSGAEASVGAEEGGAGSDSSAPATTFLSEKAGEATEAPPAEGEVADEGASSIFEVSALTLPEGVTVEEEAGTAFAAILSDEALTPQEQGQKMFDLHTELLKKQADTFLAQSQEAAQELWKKTNDGWREEIKALPEYKDNPDAEAGKVLQALVAVGADEKFFQALDMTGAGNHPAILQVLHRLTKPFIEGGSVQGAGGNKSAKPLGTNIYTSATGAR